MWNPLTHEVYTPYKGRKDPCERINLRRQRTGSDNREHLTCCRKRLNRKFPTEVLCLECVKIVKYRKGQLIVSENRGYMSERCCQMEKLGFEGLKDDFYSIDKQ